MTNNETIDEPLSASKLSPGNSQVGDVATNHINFSVTSTSTPPRWIWFQVEEQDYRFIAATNCRCDTIQLVTTQETGVQPVWIKCLNQCKVLIKFKEGIATDQVI